MQCPPARVLFLAALLTGALVLRLAVGLWWQGRLPEGQLFGFPDSHSYWVLARSIAHGEPYEYGEGMQVFRTPGYPMLLASLFVFGEDDPPVLWARGVSAVCGTLSVAAVVWIAQLLYHDFRIAMLAGVLVAIYPGSVAMSVVVLSEAPFGPLLLFQLGLWIAAVGASTTWRRVVLAGLAGCVGALATLVRPSWLLFTPLAAILETAACSGRRRHAVIGTTMLAAITVTMLPWWIRNYAVTGQFVPTTLQVGASLYDGLNPVATGASEFWFVDVFREQQERADANAQGALQGTFEFRLDQRMRRAALAWARENPWRTLQLMGIKVCRIWTPWPNAAETGQVLRTVMLLAFTPLFIASLWGAIEYCRRGWPFALCLLPAAYLTLLHSVFVGSVRYREPAMPTLIVLAAGVLGGLGRTSESTSRIVRPAWRRGTHANEP